MNLQSLDPQIWAVWQAGNYYRAATLLAEAHQQYPDQPEYGAYLGLAYLLQNKTDSAEQIWYQEHQAPANRATLLDILEAEADALEQYQKWHLALSIRQYIYTLGDRNINNQLKQLLLWVKTGNVPEAEVFGLVSLLKPDESLATDLSTLSFDHDLLLEVIQILLDHNPEMEALLKLIQASLTLTSTPNTSEPNTSEPHTSTPERWLALLKPRIKDLIQRHNITLACEYAVLCVDLDAENNDLDIIRQSLWLLVLHKYRAKARVMADILAQKSDRPIDQVLSKAVQLFATKMLGGDWAEIRHLSQKQFDLLKRLMETTDEHNPLELIDLEVLTRSLFTQPYAEDCPTRHHEIRREVGDFLQASLGAYLNHRGENYQPITHQAKPLRLEVSSSDVTGSSLSRRLRVGYIGEFLRRHPVGWIARWLFMAHNHDEFEIFTYFNQSTGLKEFSVDYFANYSEQWRAVTGSPLEVAQIIQDDNIDILVDVDSLTSSSTYGVLALKPAPIQVSWLGWDAPGLTTVDYFIADPYVLPDHAQNYYTEKIWRLPQTYVAVRGFEVDFPTQRRELLDIPVDSIVYLCNQHSMKRHDDFLRVQMQVIRQVPNSYFLIKAGKDNQTLRDYFCHVADAEGVSRDRLRFLPIAPAESLYRGNLTLADVVLDSFPYGGATTTLETLWTGLPLVTRVGEQFASRNSYTMMVNAGVEEGIAWSDEEYIDWAVTFGTDESLRQRVFHKLMRSRQTAPLWNAKQFTRQMEDAYQQMWAAYLESRQ